MKPSIKQMLIFLMVVACIVVIGACSEHEPQDGAANVPNNTTENNTTENGTNGNSPNEAVDAQDGGNDNGLMDEPEEITLTFYFPWDDEVQFMFEYGDWIDEYFPHITIDFVFGDMEQLIVAGKIPDVIRIDTSLPNFMNNRLLEYELEYDMTELIDRHNFDLSNIRPDILDGMQAYSPNDEIYALGNSIASYGLFYNKEMFDMFGVPYPTDEMTWEDVFDRHVQLTREEDGIQYRGVELDSLDWPFTQFETNLMQEDRSIDLVNHDELRTYLDMFDQIFSVPGSTPPEDEPLVTYSRHWREGNVGMFIGQNITWHLTTDRGDDPTWEEEMGFDWGVVRYPSWNEKPNMAPILRAPSLAISNTSEYKEEAFEVIQFFFSEEYQGHLINEGRFVPGIVNIDIEQYRPEWLEIDPFVEIEYASPVYTEHLMAESRVRGSLFPSLEPYLEADMDISEFLREQNDIAEEIIREEMTIQ